MAPVALQHPEEGAQERRSRDVQADGADAPIQPGVRLAEAQVAHAIECPADDRMGPAQVAQIPSGLIAAAFGIAGEPQRALLSVVTGDVAQAVGPGRGQPQHHVGA